MKGVLDRFSDDNIAVILIESIDKEIHVPTDELPSGSQEQTWFHIKEHNGKFLIDAIDREKTATEAEKSTDLQAKLRSKMKRSKYKR